MYICEACGTDISIPPLREEGDGDKIMLDKLNHLFLSTPSARRATVGLHHCHRLDQISIHALREEGDAL